MSDYDEINVFHNLWPGGYFEGDPLDPKSTSSYGDKSFLPDGTSILHATYLKCIKPYLNPEHKALEIGAGKGAWTKCMLPFKEVVVLEAVSEEESHIHDYLGYPTNMAYIQVHSFVDLYLPYTYFDYMFSFGCMCHIPMEYVQLYAISLFYRMKPGSNCFWMISDYKKAGLPPDENNDFSPNGRWYDNGLDRTCSVLKQIGYTIHNEDVGTCLRDPIIHFGVS